MSGSMGPSSLAYRRRSCEARDALPLLVLLFAVPARISASTTEGLRSGWLLLQTMVQADWGLYGSHVQSLLP